MPQSQDDAEINTQNVSLEEIKAAAPRLEMPDLDEPEDNCIICLQAVEDRTVLPECAHDRMCFECIKKWTDQSRRCPLCNTPIGSHLIHRIRSEYDYQKHFLEPLRTSPPPTHIVAEARAVYRARTRRPSEVEQDNLERAIEKRRWVYRHGLFAKHIASNPHTRFRPNPTPSQINNSPELQSRCQMFVRRELRVWPNLDVEFLTSFILSLAKSIDIRTESAVKLISEFLDINGRPSPSGGTVAEQFVHEFYSYLRSPFRDLPAYDAVVEYDTPDDIEPPPPTTSRPQHQRQNEAGPSRSRHRGGHSPSPPRSSRRYDLDDPLDASPRDADQDSEMDMDEHWIEVPPSRRDRPSRRGWDDEPRGGESRRRRESSRWDRESRQGREEVDRYREEPRRDREHSRDREAHRRERSPTLGRSPSPKREPEPSSRREKEPRLSRGERSPVSRRERSPEPRRHKESRRHKWRSPSPRRDRKGKRLEDQYEQRNKRKHYGGRESSDDERRDPKGKGRQRGYDKTSRRLDDEMRERGAEEAGFSRGGKDGGEGMPRDHDESRQRDNDERWRKNNDADTRRDNDEQKGNDNTRNRWNDDGGSAAQYRDEGKAHHRRFSGSSRRYDERASPSDSDQRPWHGGYDQRPSFSSHHRPPTDDNDDRYPTRRSHPHEERTPYKSGQATSREYDQGSSTHVRQGSDEYKRSSKRTRSPSPKSKKDESGRDQKRPAVDTQHVDNHYSRRPHRSLSASSTSSAITRSYDDHGLDDGAQQPMSISRGAQTRSSSLSRRPAAHHNVQEPKTPEVERSSTARHAAHTQFGLTSPGVDQTLSTQPGDKTGLDTRDKTQLDTRDKTRTDVRARAPRLTPLASIRAHLQGPSRPSEPLSEGLAIKGSPTRSTTNLESSATNYPSAPGPTLLPNAVERLPMALNDINTNPIHISPGSDGSSVSYSILGAAARSQVQPPLITASPDSAQRGSPNSTMGRNRLLQARLEALRAATNSDVHASHLSANSPASPTLPDTAGNQSATNSGHDDHALATSQNGQLGADPADVNTPAARFEAERRLKLQARLAARKREINAVMGGTPR